MASLRAALYIRVSTLDQAREGYSLAAQENQLRAYCASHGYEAVKLYADNGISAKDIRHRPGMTALLDDVCSEMYDIVLVWALSRFTRSVADLYDSCELLRKHNASLVSVTESFDTTTAYGRAMLGMLGVFAQMEREITSERIIAAMQEKVHQGYSLCNYVLGYDRHGKIFTINPREAGQVRHIFDLYMELGNIRGVVQKCREFGYHGKRGQPMSEGTVHVVLTNPFYAGYNTWRRTLLCAGRQPKLFDPAYFNAVQKKIELNGARAGRARKHHLLYLPTQEHPIITPCF